MTWPPPTTGRVLNDVTEGVLAVISIGPPALTAPPPERRREIMGQEKNVRKGHRTDAIVGNKLVKNVGTSIVYWGSKTVSTGTGTALGIGDEMVTGDGLTYFIAAGSGGKIDISGYTGILTRPLAVEPIEVPADRVVKNTGPDSAWYAATAEDADAENGTELVSGDSYDTEATTYFAVAVDEEATIEVNDLSITSVVLDDVYEAVKQILVGANADDTELTISVPGGVTELHKVNGLVKDFQPDADIDAISALLFDPTPQEWQAGQEYSNSGTGASLSFNAAFATKVGDDTVRFTAFLNGSAVTGEVEPAWSEDGSTPVDDGTETRPLVWTPLGIFEVWASETAIASGHIVIGNGYAWLSDGGGDTGLTEPDWPDDPTSADTVSDADITWANQGPAEVWASSTRYSFLPDGPTPTSMYQQFHAIPGDAVPGTSYLFTGQPTGVFGTAGETEPDWAEAESGDNSVWFDNDVMWQEDAGSPVSLVLTGIEAPAAEQVITIANSSPYVGSLLMTLEDEANAESEYGPDGVSAEGNRFDDGESNWNLNPLGGNQAMYVNGAWTVLQTGS